MIVEGLKLMVVGMTTVLLFLMLMILLIQIAARLTKNVTARELKAIEDEKELSKQMRKMEKLAAEGDDNDIVVITAAIAAFEAERAAIICICHGKASLQDPFDCLLKLFFSNHTGYLFGNLTIFKENKSIKGSLSHPSFLVAFVR